MDQAKDTLNYLHDNNPQAMKAVSEKVEQYSLIDIWRYLHPDESKYTWHQFNSSKQGRLDYFLVSSSLLPFVHSAEILPGFASDHSLLQLDIDFSKFVRGRGFWKFNSSLLYNAEYRDLVKDTIKKVVAQYGIINSNDNFFESATQDDLDAFYNNASSESLQQVELKINPSSFLDVLMMVIRKETMTYSARRKRERVALEVKTVQEIELLEARLNANDDNDSIADELVQKKNELAAIYAHQAQGAYVRSRSQYIVDGERPTRLFCALEKHNAVQKHVPKLVIEKDGAKFEISEQKAVEAEIFSYYKDLFTEKPVAERPISEFLSSNLAESCKRLTESQKSKMEGLLSIEELTKYLKKTKNNVAPGSTGFSNEFFKFFWADLKVFIVNAINYSYQIGQLSVTQRLGIVTIIPKGDKDKIDVTSPPRSSLWLGQINSKLDCQIRFYGIVHGTM